MAAGALDELADAIELGDRFYLFVGVAPEPRAVGAAVTAILERLAARGRTMRTVRLPTQPIRSYQDLVTSVIEPLLAGHDADTLVVVDAAPSEDDATRAWNLAFQRLNELRNAVAEHNHGPLLLCVSARLFPALHTFAPDLWSIRQGIYDLPSTAGRGSRDEPVWRRLLAAFEEPGFWDVRDPAKVLAEVDARLRELGVGG